MLKTSDNNFPLGVAFLLSQVGAHAAALFAERIAPLKLKPYHAGILRILGAGSELTQQALSDRLGMFPSRLVGLLDEVETLKLIERRANPADRRTYVLHLTKAGRDTLSELGKVARQLEDDLCAGLDKKDRKLLAQLLTHIVSRQKITPDVHPGYRQMGTT